MKKLLLILSVSVFAACSNNKDTKDMHKGMLSADLVTNPVSANGTDAAALGAMPTMDFTDTMHDFGKMEEGEVVTYDFTFKNNGKKPLLISSAAGSCGCTAPDYPHKPINPGEEGVIHVKYNSEGKMYHQEKSVTVTTNSNKGTHMLYIKADVNPKKEGEQ